MPSSLLTFSRVAGFQAWAATLWGGRPTGAEARPTPPAQVTRSGDDPRAVAQPPVGGSSHGRRAGRVGGHLREPRDPPRRPMAISVWRTNVSSPARPLSTACSGSWLPGVPVDRARRAGTPRGPGGQERGRRRAARRRRGRTPPPGLPTRGSARPARRPPGQQDADEVGRERRGRQQHGGGGHPHPARVVHRLEQQPREHRVVRKSATAGHVVRDGGGEAVVGVPPGAGPDRGGRGGADALGSQRSAGVAAAAEVRRAAAANASSRAASVPAASQARSNGRWQASQSDELQPPTGDEHALDGEGRRPDQVDRRVQEQLTGPAHDVRGWSLRHRGDEVLAHLHVGVAQDLGHDLGDQVVVRAEPQPQQRLVAQPAGEPDTRGTAPAPGGARRDASGARAARRSCRRRACRLNSSQSPPVGWSPSTCRHARLNRSRVGSATGRRGSVDRRRSCGTGSRRRPAGCRPEGPRTRAYPSSATTDRRPSLSIRLSVAADTVDAVVGHGGGHLPQREAGGAAAHPQQPADPRRRRRSGSRRARWCRRGVRRRGPRTDYRAPWAVAVAEPSGIPSRFGNTVPPDKVSRRRRRGRGRGARGWRGRRSGRAGRSRASRRRSGRRRSRSGRRR